MKNIRYWRESKNSLSGSNSINNIKILIAAVSQYID